MGCSFRYNLFQFTDMHVQRAFFELKFALGKSHGSGRDLTASSLHISTRLAHGATKDRSV